MNRNNINLYRDEHSDGWILEIRALPSPYRSRPGWYVLGVYGTHAAATAAMRLL